MIAITDFSIAGQFFLTTTLELVLLFVAISFLVGLVWEYYPDEKIRRALSTQHRITGTALGASFGALTPFCSCSTIPLLVGLLNSGVPFGACMAFLFASPLLNPVIVLMVLAFFDPVPTAICCALTSGIAVASGIVLEDRNFVRFVKHVGLGKNALRMGKGLGCCTGNPVLMEDAHERCCPGDTSTITRAPACGCSCGSPSDPATHHSGACPGRGEPPHTTHARRMWSALGFSLRLFRQVLPFLILGAAIGAFIYGFVPGDLIVSLAGPENPLAIPAAAIIGIPMYIRAETIIPTSVVLSGKGMGLGAGMALTIGERGRAFPR